MVVLYGLSTCDTCRKARKSLESKGLHLQFRDVRAAPLTRQELAQMHEKFGDALLNRRSATWRAISESARSGDPIDLILAHPTLMKRPVIISNGTLTLGWDAAAKAVHLGDSQQRT